MSPAKKYSNLQVVNGAPQEQTVSQKTDNLQSARLLHVVRDVFNGNPTIVKDWMQFTSSFGKGIFDQL